MFLLHQVPSCEHVTCLAWEAAGTWRSRWPPSLLSLISCDSCQSSNITPEYLSWSLHTSSMEKKYTLRKEKHRKRLTKFWYLMDCLNNWRKCVFMPMWVAPTYSLPVHVKCRVHASKLVCFASITIYLNVALFHPLLTKYTVFAPVVRLFAKLASQSCRLKAFVMHVMSSPFAAKVLSKD